MMRTGTVAFLTGIVLFMQLPTLPDVYWCFLLIPLAFLLIVLPRLFLPLLILCGSLWALWHADQIVSSRLLPELEGHDITIIGTLLTIPEQNKLLTRFDFLVEAVEHELTTSESTMKVRLSWYGKPPELKAGERWRLTVRLKRPHGFSNPGGFDYEGWLFQQGIGATGYVRTNVGNRRLASNQNSPLWIRSRQQIADQLDIVLAKNDFQGMIAALAIGDRQRISAEQWQVLKRTGTSHLVAISGLHIGLVAGFVFFISRWFWSRSTHLTVAWPAPKAAAIASVIAAAIYAALAGFAIPTQRALIMVVVILIGNLWQRRLLPSHSLSLALLGVLLYDPLAVLSAGFWLSFAAVATILFTMTGRLNVSGWWWKLGRLHGVIAIGLLPLLLILFQQLPLISPLANFFTVPWVSFIIVPLVLTGVALMSLWPAGGELLLTLASWGLDVLWQLLLVPLAELEWAQWQQAKPPLWTWPLAVLAVIIWLMPRGIPARWLGLVFILPALLVKPARPAEDQLWFSLLDVGQGLAAVIETSQHVLVYDTGPRFSEHFDAGSAVLIPFLRDRGIGYIDMLLIGHGDNDHIGGAQSLQQQFVIKKVLTSVPEQIVADDVHACHRGQRWQWDGVVFQILHPDATSKQQGNDASCVLKVTLGQQSLLLTGDIERPAEQLLLANQATTLATHILVVPHHGSLTSSSPEFVAATQPEYALFPVGYQNRYGFPKQPVTARYRDIKAELYETGQDGAILVRMGLGQSYQVEAYRRQRRRFWQWQ